MKIKYENKIWKYIKINIWKSKIVLFIIIIISPKGRLLF